MSEALLPSAARSESCGLGVHPRRLGRRVLLERPLLLVWIVLLPMAFHAQEVSEEQLEDGGEAGKQVVQDTSTWAPGVMFPDRYECETLSCAPHNTWDWYPVDFTNTTDVCNEVHQDIVTGFTKWAPDFCRSLKAAGMTYDNCRQDYCEMFESALQKTMHMGGPGYYGFEKCRPLLDFNRSLCENDYRDVEVWCDCFCPMMPLLDPVPGCEEEIMQFLMLGRRSPELAEIYPMSEECSADLCRWLELIGNPLPDVPVDIAYGVPSTCHVSGLPFRPKQCQRYMTTRPDRVPDYEPCPWLTPGAEEDVLECSDGTTHPIDHMEVESWSICVDHQFRWTCPANFPVMCADRNCDGSSDHCCQTAVWRCKSDAERMCPPSLMRFLPEWEGFLTPAALIGRGTTTTMDPLEAFSLKTVATTTEGNFAQQVEGALPGIVIGLGAAGAVGLVVLCFYLGKEHMQVTLGTLVGAPRLMKAYRADPIQCFKPSQGNQDPDAHKELPPMKSAFEIMKERLDNQASSDLAAAVDAAYQRGFRGLCAYAGCAPPAEEEPLVVAIQVVRMRGIEFLGGNADLLDRGETWLRTLNAERDLMKAAADARPGLTTVGKRCVAPIQGQPWVSTLVGQRTEGAIQTEAWQKVELLNDAIKHAKSAGAQESLVRKEASLFAELVSRVPELPADRCVLDPDGEGLKLLPRGNKRALSDVTGDAYLYDEQSRKAGGVDDPPPPKEALASVSVDHSRPCCAEWVRTRKCKAGRRCPWRHELPQPGDAVRESILRIEDDR